jgi:kynurenine formamidase
LDLSSLSALKVVDLSVTVSERLPGTWPGHMTFAHHNWNWFAEVDGPTGKTKSTAPYQTNFFVIDEHCGTHFDAPTHFIPPPGSGLPLASDLGAQTGDKVPLEDLMGPAVVVDVSFLSGQGGPGVSPFIEPDHVRHFEEEHGGLVEGEVVLFRTGWDRYYVEGEEGEVPEWLSGHGEASWMARPLAGDRRLPAREGRKDHRHRRPEHRQRPRRRARPPGRTRARDALRRIVDQPLGAAGARVVLRLSARQDSRLLRWARPGDGVVAEGNVTGRF